VEVELSAAAPGTPEVTTLDFSGYVAGSGVEGSAEQTTVQIYSGPLATCHEEIQGMSIGNGASYAGGGQWAKFYANWSEYYVWLIVDEEGSDPGVGGTGIPVSISSMDSAGAVAGAIASALGGLSVTSGGNATWGFVNIYSDFSSGDQPDPTAGGIDISTVQLWDHHYHTHGGDYVAIYNNNDLYYVWWSVDGSGSADLPGAAGSTSFSLSSASDDMDDLYAGVIAGFVSLGFTHAGGGALQATVDGDQPDAYTNLSDVINLTISDGASGSSPNITPGNSVTFDTPTTDWYLWFSDGADGSDPGFAGRTAIEIDLALAGASPGDLASYVAAQITSAGFNGSAVRSGDTVVITNSADGDVSNAACNEPNVSLSSSDGTTASAGAVDQTADTITSAGHGLSTGEAVTISAAGTLPAGLADYAGQTLYVISVDADTLAFAASQANALAGSRIDLTSAGSGIMTISAAGETAYDAARLDFSSEESARGALPGLESRLIQLQTEAAHQGASECRLTAALSALQTASAVYQEARSRIESADIAEDAAKSARLGILRDVSAAILAHANTQPRLLLDLLQV